jgi:hypothetical protein
MPRNPRSLELTRGRRQSPNQHAPAHAVATEEQGLAGGLVNISFQPGGAVFLVVVTAVATATSRLDATPHATLDGYHARGGRFPATVVLGLAAFAPWSDKRGR